ncbi:hypothetical protein RYX36_029318 [Vicia faba]
MQHHFSYLIIIQDNHDISIKVSIVIVRVDYVISDDYSNSSASSSDKSCGLLWNLLMLVFGGIAKPVHTIGQFLGPKRGSNLNSGNLNPSSSLIIGSKDDGNGGVTRHSPTQVLKNSNEI